MPQANIIPRKQGIDYGQLGSVIAQGINPQAQMMSKILPEMLKAKLEEQTANRKQARDLDFQTEGFKRFKQLVGDDDLEFSWDPVKGIKAKTRRAKAGALPPDVKTAVGLAPPTQQQAQQFAPQLPQGSPVVGGGTVGTQGPVQEEFVGNRVFQRDPQGNLIGERLASKVQRPVAGAVPEFIRKQLGITPGEAEATRKKAQGIKTPKAPSRQAEYIEFLKEFAAGDVDDIDEAYEFLLKEFPDKAKQLEDTYFRLKAQTAQGE